MWKSLKEYLPSVVQGWWIVAIGIAAEIVALTIAAVEGIIVPWWLYLAIGIGALVAAQFLAFHRVRVERDALRKDDKPAPVEYLLLWQWKAEAINLKGPPLIVLMSLKKASDLAYKTMRDGIHAEMAKHLAREHKENTYDSILEYFANRLCRREEKTQAIELWGFEWPTMRLVKIDKMEIHRGNITEGGYSLTVHGESEPRWINLLIRKKSAKRLIAELWEADKAEQECLEANI